MHETATTTSGLRAGRREWLGLTVLALPTLLVAMDIGALFLALPRLSADLGASADQQLWITDIYGFMLAGFLVTMGTLGDRIGRRRLLLIGAAAFTATSMLAVWSSSAAMLIAARALLGIAGATLSPSTLALISNMFRDERQRNLAVSLWAGCLFGGSAAGPVVGGLMLAHFWWGSVFLLGVPVMALLLATGPLLLPEYRHPGAGRLDPASVGLSLAAILPVVYGIKRLAAGGAAGGGASGGGTTAAVAAIVAGLAFGALFVRRQLWLTDPLVDLRLFGRRAIRGMLPAMMVASAALAGTGLMSTQFVQSVAGLSPQRAGLLQAPTGLGIAAGTLLAPVLLRWLRPLTAIALGLACSAVALLVLTQAGPTGWLPAVVVCVALAALGVGPLFALGTGMVVGSAPPEKAGSAASLSETSNVLGSTLGLALLGTLGAAVYRHGMAGTAPSWVPAAARQTVAAATAAVGTLPSGPAAGLRAAAGAAFTHAMTAVALAGTVLFVLAALLVVAALRRP
jgi:MFS transporter, DHA2 family, multidrug resistance protein